VLLLHHLHLLLRVDMLVLLVQLQPKLPPLLQFATLSPLLLSLSLAAGMVHQQPSTFPLQTPPHTFRRLLHAPLQQGLLLQQLLL